MVRLFSVIGHVLPEMLDGLAGRCVEPHGDPRKGKPPGNEEGMVNAALELIDKGNHFRYNARKLAEERYGLEKMVDMYVEVLRG